MLLQRSAKGQGDTAVWDAIQWLCGGRADYGQIIKRLKSRQDRQVEDALRRDTSLTRAERSEAVAALPSDVLSEPLLTYLEGFHEKRHKVALIHRRGANVDYSDAANPLNLFLLRHMNEVAPGAIRLADTAPHGQQVLDRTGSGAACDCCHEGHTVGGVCGGKPQTCVHGRNRRCPQPLCNLSGCLSLPSELQAIATERAQSGTTRRAQWTLSQETRLRGFSDVLGVLSSSAYTDLARLGFGSPTSWSSL